MNSVPEIFGSMVFDDATMKVKLPKETYKAVKKTIEDGKSLDISVANIVAQAMKDWAVEKGATHYTHWFQPMTGVTAEKHDSFISPTMDGKVIMEFSGKELIRGETDASSFPSGGLRAVFEARGYTAWDPTSYAFIKDDTLCIPTAYCSYGGEALDKKTPLLRSMETLNKQVKRILKLFGNDSVSVKTTVGAEQEYFLVPKELFDKRKDLIYTGRTLFGAQTPKTQELDDHYFGSIKPRVSAYMKELDFELWKLGVLSKTKHNEVAPAQHELAPIFTSANIAVDHNQLTMEIMQKVAKKHGLACLLHEKPFDGVNGSGKHNNWAISTTDGVNLLEPGKTPYENAQFLLFLCSVIKAVDDYQELLRISVASAGNDHRLGANEAPPAIVSMFLGEELNAILDAIDTDSEYDPVEKEQMRIGVHVLPKFAKDTTDRNRTSPVAFTGNKFEFRSLGSMASVASMNIIINTAVAEELRQFADELEGVNDFNESLHNLIQRVIREHKRIIFNGNGYEDAWVKEAVEKRGLSNLRTTPEALAHYLDDKNVELFSSHKVLTRAEMESRYEIWLENYCHMINIEARTMVDMVKKEYLPGISAYTREVCDTINSKKTALKNANCTYEESVANDLSDITAEIYEKVNILSESMVKAMEISDIQQRANFFKDVILNNMLELRKPVDRAEMMTNKKDWPVPSYGDLLFGIS